MILIASSSGNEPVTSGCALIPCQCAPARYWGAPKPNRFAPVTSGCALARNECAPNKKCTCSLPVRLKNCTHPVLSQLTDDRKQLFKNIFTFMSIFCKPEISTKIFVRKRFYNVQNIFYSCFARCQQICKNLLFFIAAAFARKSCSDKIN